MPENEEAIEETVNTVGREGERTFRTVFARRLSMSVSRRDLSWSFRR